MLSPFFDMDPITLCTLGTAAVVMGGMGLLWRKRFGLPAGLLPLLAALLFGILGSAAWAAGQPAFVWQSALLLAPVWLLFALARLPQLDRLGRFGAFLLRHPQGQALLLLLGGGALLACQIRALDADLDREMAESSALLGPLYNPDADLQPAPGLRAHTDGGHTVHLYRVRPEANAALAAAAEADYLGNQKLLLRLIQTAPPSLDTNCHGWVFSGGRCWVRTSDVDRILHDNGYEIVSRPVAGDLAIFRNEKGQPAHTAVVRSTSDDGLVLLESKWGVLGRYIHTPADHVYNECRCVYYRTPRGSHVLRGLDEPRPAPVPVPAAAPADRAAVDGDIHVAFQTERGSPRAAGRGSHGRGCGGQTRRICWRSTHGAGRWLSSHRLSGRRHPGWAGRRLDYRSEL